MSENQKNAVSIEVLKGLFTKQFQDAQATVELRKDLLHLVMNDQYAKKIEIKKAQNQLAEAEAELWVVYRTLNELQNALGF
jgi:hypothetical protein